MDETIQSFLDTAMSGGLSMEAYCLTVQNALTFKDGEAMAAGAIFEFCKPLGYALIICFFLWEFMQESTTKDHVTIDTYVKLFCKLIAAEMLISHGAEIISSLMGLSNFALQKAIDMDMVGIISDGYKAESQNVELTATWQGKIGLFCVAVIGGAIQTVLSGVAGVIVNVMALTIKIEVIIRFGFAGIAFAMMFGEGMRSSAVSYLKKMAACSLYAFGMIIIFQIVQGLQAINIMESISPDGVIDLKFMWKMLAQTFLGFIYPVAAIGSIATMKSIIKEALN